MNRLFSYFIERSFFVNAIAILIVGLGLISLSQTRRGLIPPFEWKLITITAVLPGASPEEMERFVTSPLQDSIRSFPQIERFTSVSSTGVANIQMRVTSKLKDVPKLVEEVKNRVDATRYRLPSSVQEIRVAQAKVDSEFFFYLALEGFDQTVESHQSFLKEVEFQLSSVPGIVKVSPEAPRRNVHILYDQKQLARYELSAAGVNEQIRQNLAITPIGTFDRDQRGVTVELARSISDPLMIADLPISSNLSRQQLRLKDIAKVTWESEKRTDYYYVNGRPSIGINVDQSMQQDAIKLKDQALKVVEQLNSQAPEGLTLQKIVDGPNFIQQQVSVLTQNGLFGFFAVFLILTLFLSFKASMMTILGLPVAYCGTLIALKLLGLDIDLISIIGLILVIGILVDDAIIVSEKYTTNLNNGMSPKKAASDAASKLFVPISAGMLTTLIAFAPILFIESEFSTILKAIPIIVIVALLVSWFESFFILPNHLVHFVGTPKKAPLDSWFSKVERLYRSFLRRMLRFRYLIAFGFVGFLGFSLWIGATKIEQNFMLNISSERVVVYMVLNQSQSPEETLALTEGLRKELSERFNSSVDRIDFRIGRIWRNAQAYEGPRFARLALYLPSSERYPTSKKEALQSEIDSFLKEWPTDDFEHLYSSTERQGGEEDKTSLISVFFSGGEEKPFSQWEQVISERLMLIPNIEEYVRDEQRYQSAWKFNPNIDKLALYGLNPVSLAYQMRSYFSPFEISEIRFGNESLKIKSDSQARDSLNFDDLNQLPVLNHQGSSVPLHFLGEWEKTSSLKSINHLNGERQIGMNFRIKDEEGNLTTAKAEVEKAVAELKAKYPTIRLKVSEADLNQASSRSWALNIAIVCLVGVLFVLAILTQSISQPFFVAIPIPFGLMGIVWALYLHGHAIGLMALIGLVGTIGVSVNASIILVDEFNQRRGNSKRGNYLDHVIEAATSRLRAITLTTITTLAGVFPMAYSIGGESGFTQPLAFAMGWGLGFAAIGTLTLVPITLVFREDLLHFFAKIARKVWQEKSSLGPQKNETGSMLPKLGLEKSALEMIEPKDPKKMEDQPSDSLF